MQLHYSVISNVGNVRANNEDNFYSNRTILEAERNKPIFLKSDCTSFPCIFAVCDGMGGQKDGELASSLAVTMLSEFSDRINSEPIDTIDSIVQEYVFDCNAKLCEEMRKRGIRMGTTLALLVFREDGVRTYNLGDSRIYRLASDSFYQVTTDHTLVMPKIKMGLLNEEQARKDKDWHKLTAYLGIFENEIERLMADVMPIIPVVAGDRFLICSDGLTDMVLDKKIEEILHSSKNSEKVVNELVNTAMDNGGKDNTTCIVIDVKSGNNIENVSFFTQAFSKIAGLKNVRHKKL